MSEQQAAAPAAETAPIEETVAPATGAAPSNDAALKEAVQDAIDEGASPAEVKEMIKEFELKVNGKTKKVKVDLNDEKELVRRLQLAEASHLAMQDKAELEKLYKQEIMKARQNPWAFLSEIGLNPDQLVEQRMLEQIEEAKKSPEQIEREKMQRELQTLREELQRREKETVEAQKAQLTQAEAARLESELMDAFQANPNLPKTRKTVNRIVDAMNWSLNNGFEDVTVADVIPAVEAEIRNEINELMSGLSEEMIEAYIGQKNLDRLRKKRLAAVKKVPTVEDIKPVTKPKDIVEPKSDKPKPKNGNTKDFFRDLRKFS